MHIDVMHVKKGVNGMTDFTFYNLSEQHLNFETVFERIVDFIAQDPAQTYRLSIGTDSKVHTRVTRFISAIHIHRVGNGAWGCLSNRVVHRQIHNVREKIYLETTFSQEIAYLFTPDKLAKLAEMIHPKGTFLLEIHLDIGRDGLTKEFIYETTERITAMGLTPKIKPESYTAFSYANKYTR